MPKATKYVFDLDDLTKVLIREAGLAEGKWRLYVEFGLGVSHFASSTANDEVAPGVVAVLKQVGIVEADEVVPGLTVDAATGESILAGIKEGGALEEGEES